MRRLLPIAAVLLICAGCGDHRDSGRCYMPPHCQAYTYMKAPADEAQLLQDEKELRSTRGVEGVRTRMDGTTATVTVYVRTEQDIAIRERLLEKGYRRRW